MPGDPAWNRSPNAMVLALVLLFGGVSPTAPPVPVATVNETDPPLAVIVCCELAPASQQPLQPPFLVIELPLTATLTGLTQTTFCAPPPPPPPLLTVTVIGADVVVFPAASRASAV